MTRNPFPNLYATLVGNLRKPAEVLAEQRARQLGILLRHAYENVPLYRSLWDAAGVRPDDIRSPADLPRLPMIDKECIVAAGNDAVDRNVDPASLDEMSTSGTSGRAITMRREIREMRLVRRSYLRSLFYNGARPWHRNVTMASTWLSKKKGLFIGLVAKTRHIYPKDTLDQQINTLREFKARNLMGQTGGLYLLAREILRRGETFPLKLLAPTGATLMPQMRQAMRDAFQTEPRDLYGAVELGAIAWQCKRGSYHIDADRTLVEIVDSDGNPVPSGETGQVVCTTLHGYALPLIRYRLRDVASFSNQTCECGIRFPLMNAPQGRINDFLPTPTGELVSPHYLYHIFDHVGGSPVKEWRIIQHAPDRLTYEYVPEDDFNSSALEGGMNVIRERFGAGVNVRAVKVESVPMTPNGKRTCIVSELDPNAIGGMRPWDIEAQAGMSHDLADKYGMIAK
ncbi:MAG: phenylacetate--CoA ligase family protein [Phycisphaerales bacterium]|nr:phenylacetate--CoA ligase family protein [Phycisphaerales bacterium]MCB9857010.1 phenylacetate--CoA ligase family protein [Phycisphaerales bacterium]MCB9861863.1 phenylacetate--CoA ligase family protein [Phycisphaerales bacterium]